MSPPTGSIGTEGRTRTVSLRVTEAEHARIREIAHRLGSSEASVIRYAIRSMLNRVAPLYEPDAKGYSLIPVFVECGAELTSYFDLDVSRLEKIINGDGRPKSERVDNSDLALLAISGLGESRVHAKLRELKQEDIAPEQVEKTLRDYFYEKYIYGGAQDKSRD